MIEHLKIKNLSISYQGKNIISNLNLSLYEGDILGLIGKNGSGKTSIIKAIMNLIKFDGTIEILNKDIANSFFHRNLIGYVPENIKLFEYFSGIEYLLYVGGLLGISQKIILTRIKPLLKNFDLDEIINKKIETYSKGSIQKLIIISAIISKPKILLLDEPLNGLDTHAIEVFLQLLKAHLKNGGSVLYSSHFLEIVSKISNRIVILDDGKIIKDSNFEELKKDIVNDSSLSEIFNNLTSNTNYNEIYKSFLNLLERE